MSNEPFTRGSCKCGNITLAIAHKPAMMLQCHCLDCQKSSGTGHTSSAYFNEADVTIYGNAKGYTVTADNGNAMTRYFCGECGSRLYGCNSGRPGLISVQVGCLDDHSWFTPQAVFYSSKRHDWDITSDEIPNHEKI